MLYSFLNLYLRQNQNIQKYDGLVNYYEGNASTDGGTGVGLAKVVGVRCPHMSPDPRLHF